MRRRRAVLRRGGLRILAEDFRDRRRQRGRALRQPAAALGPQAPRRSRRTTRV